MTVVLYSARLHGKARYKKIGGFGFRLVLALNSVIFVYTFLGFYKSDLFISGGFITSKPPYIRPCYNTIGWRTSCQVQGFKCPPGQSNILIFCSICATSELGCNMSTLTVHYRYTKISGEGEDWPYIERPRDYSKTTS